MDFDPLDLFTPAKTGFGSASSHPEFSVQSTYNSSLNGTKVGAHVGGGNVHEPAKHNEDLQDAVLIPIDPHDLPLLQYRPPAQVIVGFLRLLAPESVLNFGPTDSGSSTLDVGSIDVAQVFAERNIDLSAEAWSWLASFCPRFSSPVSLACLPVLASTLKSACSASYNAWLTRIVSSELAWMAESDIASIRSLASLRLAENCGRSAQPELLRTIEIPALHHSIVLKEPSLTADNLGLKTWGSSFILASRLASHPADLYLRDPVLELGSGTGLVGMVACLLGHACTLTDLPEIVPNLSENVALNHIANAHVAELDWSNPASFLESNGPLKYSTIILSDPLYSSQHPSWIVNMVNLFLDQSADARVLIQVPVRTSFEQERVSLWHLMDANGYENIEECVEEGYDDFGESRFIFKSFKAC